MALIPVRKEDIEPGKPLAFTLLDSEGRLVYAAGDIPKDLRQFAEQFKKGLYRDENPESDPATAEESKSGDPASLSLTPGDHLQIQSVDGSGERYLVKVVGYFAPVSLMITFPYANGKLLFVREGQVFLVRGFVGQDVLAYRTQVLKTQLHPFPYIHLAYPDRVQSMRIRKSVRIRVDIVAVISGPAGTSAGRISDLSLGGARVNTQVPFAERGDEVRLSFRIFPGGMNIYLNVRAIVRAVQQEQMEQTGVATGIEFIELSEQEKLALIGVVYQNLTKDAL